METLYKVAENPSGLDSYDNYMGEIPSKDWLVLLGRTRGADILTESNWACALELLGGESKTVEIFHFGHWACGWVEYLCVKESDSEAVQIAKGLESDLYNYPILDDEDFSEREHVEADDVWESCFDSKERIKYIRENPDQFDFNGFSNLMNCARGKYFAGCASEFLD